MPANSTKAKDSGWIDVSVGLRDGMVHWPDNPPVRIARFFAITKGDPCNVSEISLGVHTGTHMDAPIHFIESGAGIDKMPLTAVMGPARIIGIKDRESIKPEELRAHRIRRGERILFKTRNSTRVWQTKSFVEDFVYLSSDGARYLADRGIRTVGVDYLSIGGINNGPECHKSILKAGIWVIEGLDLSKVTPGRYQLICLPLKVVDGDGAPARAIVKPTN